MSSRFHPRRNMGRHVRRYGPSEEHDVDRAVAAMLREQKAASREEQHARYIDAGYQHWDDRGDDL